MSGRRLSLSETGREISTSSPYKHRTFVAVAVIFGSAAIVVAGIAAAVGAFRLPFLVFSRPAQSGVVHEFVIPQGAAEKVSGEKTEILPRVLELKVGDRLRVTNNDTVGHTVGPYYLAPGQTLDQTFYEPTVLEGFCSLHPESSVTIVVADN